MRRFVRTGAFKRDYKRCLRTDPDLDKALTPVLRLLAEGAPLPRNLADHPLTGTWRGYRDCHVRPDLVLIYKVDQQTVTLVRLGSHRTLFG